MTTSPSLAKAGRDEPQRIMYICEDCAENYPEGCGRYDRNDIRVCNDGKWRCFSCYDELSREDLGIFDDDADAPSFTDLPPAPLYALATTKTEAGK